MGHFHHAQLVGTAAEVEEAEVGHQAAAHHLVGGNGGVEAAGHQHQSLLQRAQRVAADAVVLVVDDEQALVAHFHAHFHFRVLQGDAGGVAFLAQAAADMALQLHGGEFVLAGALAAHGEDLAGDLVGVVQLALFQHIVEVAQGVLVHFEEVGDAGGAGQPLDHLAQQLRLGLASLDFKVVPNAGHLEFRVQVFQDRADVLRELADEMLAHRPALDGDFREDFDDEFHENSARAAAEKEGRGL
ncbi:hypothetical protein D3C80_1053420 [compost metagenome]